MLRSDLCDYSDAYIVTKGRIYVKANANTDVTEKDFVFKNNARFRLCITSNWGVLILPSINCEVELDLIWTINFVWVEEDNIIDKIFTITDTKLYVLVVTLMIISIF